jgi:carboxyl-terminal processing protease
MNRSRVLFLVVSLALTVPLVAGVLWSAAVERRADDGGDSLYKYLTMFSEVLGLVRNDYVDATEAEKLLAGALDGATDALDPFSVFVPREARTEFARVVEVGRSRSGISLVHDHGIAYVLAVEDGSPAATAGFTAGDLLAEVDGVSTRELPHWRLERLLAGQPGDKLEVEILRRGEAHDLELVLADYAPPTAALTEAGGLPLLRLPSIGAAAAVQVRPLLEQLASAGATRLLIDLRGVAGGASAAAYEVAALLADGSLGRRVARGTTVREFAGAQPVWKGEIVVLVDGGTQGPAELVAAILRDRAGARLVGARTFGWAGEREMIELSEGAALLLTTSFYCGPDGTPMSKGLAPEVLVDDLQRSFGERDKPLGELILERGIEVLSGADATARPAA